MRFVSYSRALTRGIKVDWDAPLEVTDEIRRAMEPQGIEELRAGRLQRPFHVQANRLATRPGRGPERGEVMHPRGAVIFATSAEDQFWIQADDAPRGGARPRAKA